MSFRVTDHGYSLFERRDSDPSAQPSADSSASASPLKIPVFQVRQESAFQNCLASVKALCSRTKLPAFRGSSYLSSDGKLTGFRAPGLGVVESLLLHCALILSILFVPMLIPARAPALSTAFLPPEVIFYPVPDHHPTTQLPRIAPPGRGGRPGSGVHPTEIPDLGRTATNRDLTVISKPLHPDNKHQTIIQPASPPDLRIADDIELPNLSLGTLAAPKKPNLDLSMKKPTQDHAKLAPNMVTPVADANADFSVASSLQPTNSLPKLPIPTGTMGRPTRHDGSTEGTSGSEAPDVGAAGDGRAILAIGINPSGPSSGLAVPPGNRYGEFSIAPGSGTSGSPGGSANGVPGGGGSAGNGPAGDESVGLGPSHEGGGGGRNGSPSPISIKGTGTSTGGVLAVDPRIEARSVYPVLRAEASRARRNGMIISAGPMGGGGLDAYGALTCGKIYTIFLPMNGAGWTMEYCPKSGSTEAASVPSSRVVQLEAGLVPPDLDLDSRYDFQRTSVPAGKAQKLIVLRGTLQEDGTVDGLEVYQGVVPEMDEAARLAFSHWKFKPATRAGKPVALQVLIGIPPGTVAPRQSP